MVFYKALLKICIFINSDFLLRIFSCLLFLAWNNNQIISIYFCLTIVFFYVKIMYESPGDGSRPERRRRRPPRSRSRRSRSRRWRQHGQGGIDVPRPGPRRVLGGDDGLYGRTGGRARPRLAVTRCPEHRVYESRPNVQVPGPD